MKEQPTEQADKAVKRFMTDPAAEAALTISDNEAMLAKLNDESLKATGVSVLEPSGKGYSKPAPPKKDGG